MRITLCLFCSIFFIFLLLPSKIFAYDPLSVENNRFGIHILFESDLEDAANLVNSSGGQWGYVTVVIAEDDRNIAKWQKIFDRMRELKLIPIVRIATKANGPNWNKPQVSDARVWAAFLNSLNWVIKNRYVILFNEPNHDKEWGGQANPAEYADVAAEFAKELKGASADYFILTPGMDLAAGDTRDTISADTFYRKMYEHNPDVFKNFDGLASHSYPNPDFSGKASDSGKNTIRGYLWELDYLNKFGLRSNIPVFITETGWRKNKDIDITQNMKDAYHSAWNHPQVVAVTPFVLNYETPPFAQFSWIEQINGEKNFTPWYEDIKNMPKNTGQPIQEHSYKFLEAPLPTQLIQESTYILDPQITNDGQSIWQEGDIEVKINSTFPNPVIIDTIKSLKPLESLNLAIHLNTPNKTGNYTVELEFFYKGEQIGEKVVRSIEVVPPTQMHLQANLGLKRKSNATDLKLLIYEADRLIKAVDELTLEDGLIKVANVHDVIPNQTYRFVLIKHGYLPAQTVTFLNPEGITDLNFGRLLPIDFNGDGMFSIKDVVAGLLSPLATFKLLIPF